MINIQKTLSNLGTSMRNIKKGKSAFPGVAHFPKADFDRGDSVHSSLNVPKNDGNSDTKSNGSKKSHKDSKKRLQIMLELQEQQVGPNSAGLKSI